MAADDEQATRILVWFEDNREGRAALLHAYEIAEAHDEDLMVVTVATHERVVGCGRCMSGTVLWNLEMKKIAHEELTTARRMLDGADEVAYQLVIGDPAEAIAEVAERTGAHTVVLPEHRKRLFEPPNRRDVGEKIARRGPWQVIAGSQLVRG